MSKKILTVGKTYKITATPDDIDNEECKKIFINGDDVNADITAHIGTYTFTMTKEITDIEAEFAAQ